MTRLACIAGLASLLLAGSATAQPPAPPPAPPPDHVHQPPPAPPPPPPQDPHAGHQMPPDDLPPFIPPVTDADRQAAFPPVHPHHMHDRLITTYVLVDQLEWQAGGEPSAVSGDLTGWVGTDRDRLWFRGEADRPGGRFDQAQLQVLYGRAVARWWTLMAGVRQDVRDNAPRTAAAIGVQGLAPFWVDVEATLYVEGSGRSHVRMEAEHDLLITNRLVLQPLLEFEIYSKADPELRLGSGLSTVDAGLRLRYEVRREIAPYVGLVWHRKYFGTAERAGAAGVATRRLQLALGLRLWW
jgi:copper resistance protein B